MTIENLIIPVIFAELSILLLFYFSTYDPLKKWENKLLDKRRITKIKKYLLRNALVQIKPLLLIMFFLFLISLILLILSAIIPKLNQIWFVIILLCAAYYVIVAGGLFTLYITYHRNKEAVCGSTSLEQILRILKIKRNFILPVTKMLEICEKTNGKEKRLLTWLLDNLEMKDKRIQEN